MKKLYEIEDLIKDVAKSQPNIDLVLKGDIYQLNTNPKTTYPCVCITQNTHREDEDFRYYGLYLYYVDRLLEDKSNQLEIQSQGIEALSNIINTLIDMDIDTENEIVYTPFYQSFADLCAGVYAQVTFSVPVSSCADLYSIISTYWTRNQNKTITENGTYTYDAGYTGLGKVVVNVEGSGQPDLVDFEVTVPADTTNTFTPQPPHQGFKKVKVIAAPDGRVDELQERINELESEVEDKQRKLDSIAQIEIKANGTYTAEVGYNPIIVDVGEEPQLQEKDVSLETIYQTIYPDSDYVGMRAVYVNCQDIVEGVKEEYQAKIDKSEMDYTKVGNVYVTPPLADQYGFMAVIKCTRQGRLLLNMDNDMSLYFSNYKVGVDGDVSVHAEMSQVYFEGNFEKDKNYVLWFNTPNGNTHVGTTDFEEGDIKSIVIPSTVTSVGEEAFNSSYLELITCYATTAPTLETRAFTECMETGILRVPQGATGYNNWLTQLGSGWTIEYMS